MRLFVAPRFEHITISQKLLSLPHVACRIKGKPSPAHMSHFNPVSCVIPCLRCCVYYKKIINGCVAMSILGVQTHINTIIINMGKARKTKELENVPPSRFYLYNWPLLKEIPLGKFKANTYGPRHVFACMGAQPPVMFLPERYTDLTDFPVFIGSCRGGGGTASLKIGTHCQTTAPAFQRCPPLSLFLTAPYF